MTGFKRSDDELIRAFKKGSIEAFEELVVRYEKPIINFFYHMCYNRATAEDMAQDVFLKLFVNLKGYQSRGKFASFLFKCAKNLWIDRIRAEKQRMLSLDTPVSDASETTFMDMVTLRPDETVDAREHVNTAVRNSIRRLPEEHRMVIVLSEFCGMNYVEISETLDIPIGTVKSRLHNAVEKLKEIIKNVKI